MSQEEPVEQKLKELDLARGKVKAQIDESQAVLDAIEEKIETVKRQSKERLLQDERVDNKLVMTAKHIRATETAARAIQNGAGRVGDPAPRFTKSDGNSGGNTQERVILVPNPLSEDDITVRPKEKDKDKDREKEKDA